MKDWMKENPVLAIGGAIIIVSVLWHFFF